MNEPLSSDIHVPLTPSQRRQIDDLARADLVKPATKARQLIVAALVMQQKSIPAEVHHA